MSHAEDFWLGLEKIHSLTQHGVHILRVDVEDWREGKHWAEYHFSVRGPSQHYILYAGHFSGDLPDAMTNATGARFSTKETNGDQRNPVCTRSHTGEPLVCFRLALRLCMRTTHLTLSHTPFGRRLVVQKLRRDQSERKVFVDEVERPFREEEGRSLEARNGAVALPQNDQDERTAGRRNPTEPQRDALKMKPVETHRLGCANNILF